MYDTVWFKISAKSALLIFITILAGISILKFKVFGFTLHLLLILAAVAALSIAQGLMFLHYLNEDRNV